MKSIKTKVISLLIAAMVIFGGASLTATAYECVESDTDVVSPNFILRPRFGRY